MKRDDQQKLYFDIKLLFRDFFQDRGLTNNLYLAKQRSELLQTSVNFVTTTFRLVKTKVKFFTCFPNIDIFCLRVRGKQLFSMSCFRFISNDPHVKFKKEFSWPVLLHTPFICHRKKRVRGG